VTKYDPELDAAQRLAEALGWPFVDLESYKVSCGILRRVPAELACRMRCVPMVFNAHRVVLVVDDPFHGYYLAAHPEQLGPPYDHSMELALGTRKGIDAALARRLTLVEG